MFPQSKLMITIVAASNVFVIILETIQMNNRKGYFRYMKNINYLFGTSALILHAADRYIHEEQV